MTSSTSSSASLTTVTEPLTTIYTPPAWCKNRIYTSDSTTNGTFVASHSVNDASACYPPNYYGQSYRQIYSPGVCPIGWTVATSTTGLDSVAVSLCCPSGMSSLGYYACASEAVPPSIIAINADTNQSISTAVLDYEWYIAVAWASSDLDLFTPKSAPLLTRGVAPSTLPPSASAGATSQASKTASPSSSKTRSSAATVTVTNTGKSATLSTGAKAGIGIGAATGGLLVIAGIVFFVLWSRKQKRRKQMPAEISTFPHRLTSPELPGSPAGHGMQEAKRDSYHDTHVRTEMG